MPWKDFPVMEERLRFVARLLEGETMTDLCREFGISRKTGYKLFNRYRDEGVEAFTDRCATAIARALGCDRASVYRLMKASAWVTK